MYFFGINGLMLVCVCVEPHVGQKIFFSGDVIAIQIIINI